MVIYIWKWFWNEEQLVSRDQKKIRQTAGIHAVGIIAGMWNHVRHVKWLFVVETDTE